MSSSYKFNGWVRNDLKGKAKSAAARESILERAKIKAMPIKYLRNMKQLAREISAIRDRG